MAVDTTTKVAIQDAVSVKIYTCECEYVSYIIIIIIVYIGMFVRLHVHIIANWLNRIATYLNKNITVLRSMPASYY